MYLFFVAYLTLRTINVLYCWAALRVWSRGAASWYSASGPHEYLASGLFRRFSWPLLQKEMLLLQCSLQGQRLWWRLRRRLLGQISWWRRRRHSVRQRLPGQLQRPLLLLKVWMRGSKRSTARNKCSSKVWRHRSEGFSRWSQDRQVCQSKLWLLVVIKCVNKSNNILWRTEIL